MHLFGLLIGLLSVCSLVAAAPVGLQAANISSPDWNGHYGGEIVYVPLGGGFEYLVPNMWCIRIFYGKTIMTYDIWKGFNCTFYHNEDCTGPQLRTGDGPETRDNLQDHNLISYKCLDHRHKAAREVVTIEPSQSSESPDAYTGTVWYDHESGYRNMEAIGCFRLPGIVSSMAVLTGSTCYIYQNDGCTGASIGGPGPFHRTNLARQSMLNYQCFNQAPVESLLNEKVDSQSDNGSLAQRNLDARSPDSPANRICGHIEFEDVTSAQTNSHQCQWYHSPINTYTILDGCTCFYYPQDHCQGPYTAWNGPSDGFFSGRNIYAWYCIDHPILAIQPEVKRVTETSMLERRNINAPSVSAENSPTPDIDAFPRNCGRVEFEDGTSARTNSNQCQGYQQSPIQTIRVYQGCTCNYYEKATCGGLYIEYTTGGTGTILLQNMHGWFCVSRTVEQLDLDVVARQASSNVLDLATTGYESEIACGNVMFDNWSGGSLFGSVGCRHFHKTINKFFIKSGWKCDFYKDITCQGDHSDWTGPQNEDNLKNRDLSGYNCYSIESPFIDTRTPELSAAVSRPPDLSSDSLSADLIHDLEISFNTTSIGAGTKAILDERGCGTAIDTDGIGHPIISRDDSCFTFDNTIKSVMIGQGCTCIFFRNPCEFTILWVGWTGPARGSLEGRNVHGYKCNEGPF